MQKPLKYQLLLLLVLLATTGAVYSPGLQGPLLLDDFPHLSPLLEAHTDDWRTLASNNIFSNSGPFKRPVSMASFIFNAVVHGSDIWYWKATNVAIHLVNGLLVFLLVMKLLQAGRTPRDRAGWLALLAAGVWLLHPLHVSTVLYTVQRMSQLSALFAFAGLLVYAIGRDKQICRTGRGWNYIALAFLVCFPLAVLSKENGLLFPYFVVLMEALVYRFRGNAETRQALKKLAFVVIVLPSLIASVYLLTHIDSLVTNGYDLREFTLVERVLTQFRVLMLYLYQLLLPLPGTMGFYHDDILVSRSLVEPVTTLLSLLFLIFSLYLAWRLRNKWPLLAFGVLFFLVAHLLESTIFPLELMFEHRNYLASFGVVLMLIVILNAVITNSRILSAIGVAILVIAALLSLARADTWGSHASLLTHMYGVHPDSRRLTTIFANTYAESGHYEQAMAMLKKFDDNGFRVNRLYVTCLDKGRLEDHELAEETSLLDGPVASHAMTGLIGIANLGLDGKCSFSSRYYLDLLDRALALPINGQRAQKLHMYRAHYYHRENQGEEAISALEKAFSALPDTPIPLFLATEWLLEAGELERARAMYQRARAVSGGDVKYKEFTDRIDALFNQGDG